MSLGMLQGFVGRSSLEVSPRRSEPRVSLGQQLAGPGSSGIALEQLWYSTLTCGTEGSSLGNWALCDGEMTWFSHSMGT